MQVNQLDTYDDISLHGARIFYDTVKGKPKAVLGLATGGTPLGLYREFVRLVQEKQLVTTRLHTVNLDEYVGLPPQSPLSYRAYMDRHLFSPLGLTEDQTHLPDGHSKDIDGECTRYERLVQQLGGIDVQLLGVGRNGHIAFNEPGTTAQSYTHCVWLTESTRHANASFFGGIENVPRNAVTMGMATIMESRKLILLASGEQTGPFTANVSWSERSRPRPRRLGASLRAGRKACCR